jgi:hypothetical protein
MTAFLLIRYECVKLNTSNCLSVRKDLYFKVQQIMSMKRENHHLWLITHWSLKGWHTLFYPLSWVKIRFPRCHLLKSKLFSLPLGYSTASLLHLTFLSDPTQLRPPACTSHQWFLSQLWLGSHCSCIWFSWVVFFPFHQ